MQRSEQSVALRLQHKLCKNAALHDGIASRESVKSMRPKTLLCVDDDPAIRRLYAALFDRHAYHVHLAEDGWEALSLLQAQAYRVDAVLLDFQMPGINGAQLAAEIKRNAPTMPIILVSGDLEIVENPPSCVDAAVEKGIPVSRIIETVEALIPRVKDSQSSAQPWTAAVPLVSA